jgi:hypothetical protein
MKRIVTDEILQLCCEWVRMTSRMGNLYNSQPWLQNSRIYIR